MVVGRRVGPMAAWTRVYTVLDIHVVRGGIMQDERTVVVHNAAELVTLPTRRGFLKALGLGGSLVLMPSLFAACTDNTNQLLPPQTPPGTYAAQTISLGSDIGVFQFAAVLEQLESRFYESITSLSNFTTIFPSAAEQELLLDLRNDEVTHRELFRTALGSSFPTVTIDFSTLLANPTRTAILQTALTLETNGVAAYNGAGAALKNATNLLAAGKIVSVEARHASAIADTLDTAGTAFSDLTASVLAGLGANPANALDAAAAPATVAANAQPFIKNTITLTA